MFKVKKTMPFISLFIFFGLSMQIQVQAIDISAKFLSGDLIFTWTNYSVATSSYDVLITRNKISYWTVVKETQYTVNDVLIYDDVSITVRARGSPTDYLLTCEGKLVDISTKCNSGKVTFAWTTLSNKTNYHIMITRDTKHDNWTSVTDNQFDVSDALLFDSISITVKVPGSKVDNIQTYTVLKVKVENGESANLSWVAPYFPSAQGYTIYHINNPIKKILEIDGKKGPVPSSNLRYKYLTEPYNSTNITFEIENVTLEDAGYYNGGAQSNAATSCGAVVLCVYDKPKKPEIGGILSIPINTSSELTCSSQSASAPDYYSKLVTLSYTWFVNDKKMDGETNQTLRFKVTRGHKYNNYSCTATEEGLESDRSDTVQIDPLYGPDEITINPHPNMQDNGIVTVREGETFGPYQCLVDCHPPCNLTWTYINSSGQLNFVSLNGNLSQQQINRDIELFQCVATWRNQRKKEKNITLNVQYLEEPLFFINNIHSSESTKDLQENIPFNVSCLVEGNPVPNVRLFKGTENISTNRENTKWANHTVISAECEDTGNYTCTGSSEGFNVSGKTFRINILCNVQIDDSDVLHTKYGSPSGMNVRVASVIPVIAYPSPQSSAITWVGPGTEPIQSNVSGRGVAYKHWINTSFPVYNHTYFGNYTMIYGNETLLTITISEQDRPQTPLNFTRHSYAGGHINLTWVSGFNGGLEQYFVLSLKKDFKWETVANVSDPGEGSVVYFNPESLDPGQYRYRLESCNIINCSTAPAEVEINITVEGNSTVSPLETNEVEYLYVIIGASVAFLILIVILGVALVIICRRKNKTKKKNEGDNSKTSGGEMYATVDKSLLKGKKPKADAGKDDVIKKQNEEECIEPGTETYAVVDKNLKENKKGDLGQMSNNAGKSKLMTKQTAADKSKQGNNETNESVEDSNLSTKDTALACKTNNEGLIYIEVDFVNQSEGSRTNQAPVIHGEDNRTEYTFVDFSKKAPPMSDADDNEENQEES